MNVLFLGDVVGAPGRDAMMRMIPKWRAEHALDAVVVNGENAAGGRGITPKIAAEWLQNGVDVITTGDHVWDQKDLAAWLVNEPRVLRPHNYPAGAEGKGSVIISTPKGRLAVLQLQGRSFMQPPLENPFSMGRDEARSLRNQGVAAIVVDFHAETTSEKIAMGYYLDGLVSAVLGTHTHVQTADETILDGGTAYITDVGMCGPVHGVLGRDVASLVRRFVTSLPTKFPIAGWPARVCGVILQIDESTGRATSITRLAQIVEK